MWHHPLRLLWVALVPCLVACDEGAVHNASAPVVDGVPATHGDGMSGGELAAVLGCGACHPGAPGPAAVSGATDAAAPDLEDVVTRWDPASLSAYLQDPVPLREGVVTRMPDFRLAAAEAAAITVYLVSRNGDEAPRGARAELAALAREHPTATAERGARIAAALNCAGCHAGLGDARPVAPPLAGVGERLRADWLRRYLATPTAVRPAGHPPGSGSRMPDFRLSDAEADSLTAWLIPGADGADGAQPVAEAAAPSSHRLAKAEVLLRDHLSCLGCHRLGGEGGRMAPALDAAAGRLRPEYLRRVVHDPAGAAPGTIMPRPLEDSATLALVIDYLLRAGNGEAAAYVPLLELELNPRPAPGTLHPAAEPDGATLYQTHCAACHGGRGAGDGFNARHIPARPTAHADAAFMSTRPDATLFDGVHGGGHILGRSHRMPAFGGTLSTAEIRTLVTHMRELCGCDGPEWASP